jgi:hypothetical protein
MRVHLGGEMAALFYKKIDSFDDERHYALFSCARDVTRRERED